MTTNLKDVASWGAGWQASGNWQSHTVGAADAARLTDGYLAYLATCCDWRPTGAQHSRGLDIGAGAGYVAAAFAQRGLQMVATEWNDAGLELIARENPALETRKLDILTFDDKAAWDLIFCRELYPFTRVNEFTNQLAMVSALLDGLRPGGVIVLSGSAVQWPHCTDYALLIETLRRDPRVAMAGPQYPEALLRRLRFGRWGGLGALAYRAVAAALWPLLFFKRRFRRWAMINAIVIRRKADA